MSKQELYRGSIMQDVTQGIHTLREASELLQLSYRQVRRIYKRYKQSGIIGLQHGLVGRASSRKLPTQQSTDILKLLRDKYEGFGPTLASEHLAEEDGITISRERLRQLMHKNGIKLQKRKRSPYRSRRQRKERFGDMLQIDGSLHDWFGTGEKCYLMNLIDDATGTNLCLFSEEETTIAAATLLWQWIELYGIPRSIYADRKNVYIHNEHPHKASVFGEMCGRLAIAIIPAHSPQAKGRVERSNSTHQDRMIKKMALKQIKSIPKANEFLNNYIIQHNTKFTVMPESNVDAHKPKPEKLTLDNVFYKQANRVIMNDWTVRYKNSTLQIIKQSNYPPAKSNVLIHEDMNGLLTLNYRGIKVEYKVISTGDTSIWLKEDISILV